MLRVFFSRRWLGWHALLLAGIAVLVVLGRWQWNRAQSEWGTMQNLGYAFEWWLFACLAVYGWWREIRADARAAKARSGDGDAGAAAAGRSPGASTAGLGRSAVPAGADVEEPDAEVAAYNAYLTQLNTRYARQRD